MPQPHSLTIVGMMHDYKNHIPHLRCVYVCVLFALIFAESGSGRRGTVGIIIKSLTVDSCNSQQHAQLSIQKLLSV